MLVAIPEAEDPRSRRIASLWNRVHTPDPRFRGVQIALLVARPVRVRTGATGPVILYWFTKRAGRVAEGSTRITMAEFLQAAPDLHVETVLFASPDVGSDVAKVLDRLGFSWEIPGQVTGFWFGEGRPVPEAPPTYRPTGAVLPQLGTHLDGETTGLDLVEIDYVWFPLSEAATAAYDHSVGLQRGERWVFAPVPTASTPWPTVYQARIGGTISPENLGDHYQPRAAERARPRPLIQLILRRS